MTISERIFLIGCEWFMAAFLLHKYISR